MAFESCTEMHSPDSARRTNIKVKGGEALAFCQTIACYRPYVRVLFCMVQRECSDNYKGCEDDLFSKHMAGNAAKRPAVLSQ